MSCVICMGTGRSGVDSALRQHFHLCTQVMYFLVGTSHFAVFYFKDYFRFMFREWKKPRVVLYHLYNLEFRWGWVTIQDNGLWFICEDFSHKLCWRQWFGFQMGLWMATIMEAKQLLSLISTFTELSVRWHLLYNGLSVKQHETLQLHFSNFFDFYQQYI